MLQCFFIIFLIISLDAHALYKREITCATTIFEPYTIKDSTGIDVDILNIIAKKLNWKITYQYYPWARLISHEKTGRIDAVLTDKAVGDFYARNYVDTSSFPLKHSGLATYLTFKKNLLKPTELVQINRIISNLINDKVLISIIYKKYQNENTKIVTN